MCYCSRTVPSRVLYMLGQREEAQASAQQCRRLLRCQESKAKNGSTNSAQQLKTVEISYHISKMYYEFNAPPTRVIFIRAHYYSTVLLHVVYQVYNIAEDEEDILRTLAHHSSIAICFRTSAFRSCIESAHYLHAAPRACAARTAFGHH